MWFTLVGLVLSAASLGLKFAGSNNQNSLGQPAPGMSKDAIDALNRSNNIAEANANALTNAAIDEVNLAYATETNSKNFLLYLGIFLVIVGIIRVVKHKKLI